MAESYRYRAKNREGKVRTGSVEADSREAVVRQLREQGFFVTSISPHKKAERKEIDLSFLFFWQKGLGTKELARFCEQFSVMISAGLTIVDSLQIIREQTDNDDLARVLGEVVEDIEAGENFSSSLIKHPEHFPNFFCFLVKAGETGGVLEEVLKKLAAHYRRQARINEEVKSALYYPAVVLVVALLAVFFLLAFVVPTLMNMFADLGADLPLPTRILMGIGDFMENWWWLTGGVIGLVVTGAVLFIRTPRGKKIWDALVLRLPMIGELLRRLIIARFASTLSLLLGSGVNLTPALTVVGEVAGNSVYSRILQETRSRLREGVNISTPLAESGEFPPMVLQMIMIGEETGSLEVMLRRISEYYDVEVENAIEGGISLIEPAMIVVLGVVVGFIAVSVILPLFDMYSAIM